MATVGYRILLAVAAMLSVWFVTDRDEVLEYAIVLLVEQDGRWRTARVYDNAHGHNDMHRYTLTGGKQPAESFQSTADAGEAMRAARDQDPERIREHDRRMASLEQPKSTAAEFAAERFRLATDLAVKGHSPYPNGAVFLASDLPNLGEALARYARERCPIVIVYPDGDERVLLPQGFAQPEAA